MDLEFENIGGSSSESQYSLYDYSKNVYGETVMSIVVHIDGDWWFAGEPKSEMNSDHMKALHKFLEGLLNK